MQTALNKATNYSNSLETQLNEIEEEFNAYQDKMERTQRRLKWQRNLAYVLAIGVAAVAISH